ncbi:MAG: hypothetical protein WD844_05780 [Thermoleophilaceae bacterium]
MSAAPPEAWRVKRSMGRCWGFTLGSLGIYALYWVYQTRKLLDRELRHGRDDATLHTLGSLVPILNYFVMYWLWRDIDRLRQSIGLPRFEVGLFVGLSVIGGTPVTYSIVLNRLNEYWDHRSQGWATDAPVTSGEKLTLLGGALFALAMLALLVAVIVALASGA